MDFYSYYLRRITTAKDKKAGIESCCNMAMRLFDTGPMTWSIESGACLLVALHEVDSSSTDVMPIFDEVEQALVSEIQGIRLDLEAEQRRNIRTTGCGRPRRRKRQEKKGGGN